MNMKNQSPVQHVVLPDRTTITLNAQRAFLVISENLRTTCSFDRDGRLLGCFLDGKNYKRGLDSTIMVKYIAESGEKQRDILSDAEARELIGMVHAWVVRIRDAVVSQGVCADILPWLNAIVDWDDVRLLAERTAFQSIYNRVGILPPDQYLSVVLQATEGCTWNRCTFCTFYRDTPFGITSPSAFRQHARQVRDFLGPAIYLRKSIFLADANALIIPQQRLLELVRIVHEEFPIGEARHGEDYVLDGIYSFLDIFGAEKKTLHDYRELSAYKVRRIYIGLESGDEELFRLLNKPGSPAECVEAVHTIKTAGINVGIILLAGAGGDRWYDHHMDGSIQRLREMCLNSGDIVYLSPLVVSADTEYARRIAEAGIEPLPHADMMQQVNQFKTALKTAGGPRVTLYHIEEFLY